MRQANSVPAQARSLDQKAWKLAHPSPVHCLAEVREVTFQATVGVQVLYVMHTGSEPLVPGFCLCHALPLLRVFVCFVFCLLRPHFSSALPKVPRHARLPESAYWVHPCLPTCATPVLLKHHIIRPDPSWPPRSACPALLLPASELLLPLDFLPLLSPASSTRLLLRSLLPFINDQPLSTLPGSSHQHHPSCLRCKYWTPSSSPPCPSRWPRNLMLLPLDTPPITSCLWLFSKLY